MVRVLQRIAQNPVLPALALACALTAGPAHAEVYISTSDSGSLRFSDDPRSQQGSRSHRLQENTTAFRGIQANVGAARDGAIRIPFEEELGLIQVRARLNERVETAFFVDTGTSDIMIPLRVARTLGFCETCANDQIPVMGIGGVRMLPVMQLTHVALGGAQVRSVRVIVNPDLQVGLLGRGFLKNFVYTIDDSSRTLELRAR